MYLTSKIMKLEVVGMIAMQAATQGQVGLARLERSDGEALCRFFYRLSPETVYRRFHSPLVRPDQARPERLLDIDHHNREAVVAVVDGEIVGVARYFRRPGIDTAELAVVVADEWQRRGLATRLVSGLIELARSAGVQRFTVNIQADNRPALALLRQFDHPGATFSAGHYESAIPTSRAVGSR
jgi:RimJ/RimL family protein N-acetyltransferase